MARIPLNVDLIRHRAADIRRELEVLTAYGALPAADFVTDGEKVRAARYGLIVSIEAAAAICNHLAARHGRVADSYPACFEALGDLGIADARLSVRLVAMARLRNILVHGYARVDDSRVHEILRNDLADLAAYLSAVAAHLRSVEGVAL
jgi:uncharacterized protein YutE (UPF0331/DUF86 family)